VDVALLQLARKLEMITAVLPPSALPTNSQFFLPTVMLRNVLSDRLLSILQICQVL
jgi:hypothetical protein